MPGFRLCSLFDLPIRGGRLFRDVDDWGRDVLLFKLEGGALVAWDAACPHAGALLRPENEIRGVLTCYLHQWRFNVEDGSSLDVPGCELERYPVRTEGVDVFVDLPEEEPTW